MKSIDKAISLVSSNKVLSSKELALEIRRMINLENDAINEYLELAEQVNDPAIKKQIIDIASEEKVHVGEFQQILYSLDGNEEELEKTRKEGETMKKYDPVLMLVVDKKEKDTATKAKDSMPALDKAIKVVDAEKDTSWGVWMSGGSIAEKSNYFIKEGLSEEEAKALAKRRNDGLSAGEKQYYKIKYTAKKSK